MAGSIHRLVGILLVPLLALILPGSEIDRFDTQLRFYVQTSLAWPELYVLASDTAVERSILRLNRGRKSPPVAYRGPRDLTLWTDVWDPDLETMVPQAWARIPLPASERILVILLDANAPDVVMTGYAVDDSYQAHPPDHLSFLNLTPFPFIGAVGEHTFPVKRGLSAPVDLSRWLGQADVLIGLLSASDKGFHVVMENRIRVVSGWRSILLILPGQGEGVSSLDVQAVRILEAVVESETLGEE